MPHVNGVVIESITEKGKCCISDLLPDDVLISWKLDIHDAVKQTEQRGNITSPFDFQDIIRENSHRDSLTFLGSRGDKTSMFSLSHCSSGISVRAALSSDLLTLYEQGIEAFENEAFPEGHAKFISISKKFMDSGMTIIAAWIYYKLGDLYRNHSKWNEAIDSFDHGLSILTHKKDSLAVAQILEKKVLCFENKGDFDTADTLFKEIITLRQQHFGTSMSLASTLADYASFLMRNSKVSDADNNFMKSVTLFDTLSPKSAMAAQANYKLGLVKMREAKYKECSIYCQKANNILKMICPDSYEVSYSWTCLGNNEWYQAHFKEAEAYYLKALKISEKLDPQSSGVAALLNNLGVVAKRRGDLASARDYLERALAIDEKLTPGSLNVASTLTNLGNISLDQNDLKTAEKYYLQGLEIKQKFDPHSLSSSHNLYNLGLVAFKRGLITTAEKYYLQSLKIREKEIPGTLDLADTYVFGGHISYRRGFQQRAENLFLKARSLYETFNPESHDIANIELELGNVELDRNDYDQAEYHYRKSLDLQRRIDPQAKIIGSIYNNLGLVQIEKGDLKRAEAYYKKALEHYKRIAPQSISESQSLGNLGLVALENDDLEIAQEYILKGLAIKEKLTPQGFYCASGYYNLGLVMMKKNDLDKAEHYFHKAYNIQETLAQENDAFAETSHALGILYKKKHVPDKSLVFLKKAVEILEIQESNLGGGEKTTEKFFGKYADYFRDLIELQNELNDKEEAFNTLERFRARSFLAILAERDIDFTKDAPETVLNDIKEVNIQYDEVQKMISELSPSKDNEEVNTLIQKLQYLQQKRITLKEMMRTKSSKLASLQYPDTLNFEAVSTLLEKNDVLVSYCVGKDNTLLFALYKGKLSVYVLPVSRKELHAGATSLRNMLSTPFKSKTAFSGLAENLYNLLIKPVQEYLVNADSLIICPDGPLHLLPFSSLKPNASHYLVETIPISYILSATVLGEIKNSKRTTSWSSTLIAVANPFINHSESPEKTRATTKSFFRIDNFTSIPEVANEVKAIADLFPGSANTYIGDQVTENLVKSIASNSRYFHFACHGYYNETYPLDSGLILTGPDSINSGSENGILQAWEVFEQFRTNAELITLSACQTALGKESGGEGLIGLTRAFIYSGSSSVLSSLWSITDTSTSQLMVEFYTRLKSHVPKNRALQQAQLSLINSGTEFSHPFYWAAFVLNGDMN